MRFNPLWLIVLFFFMPAFGLLFLPWLVLAVLVLAVSAGGSSLSRAPGQIWTLLKSATARANFVLAHAACGVLYERGLLVPACWSDERGFFLSGLDDENAAYEATQVALARLKNGEDDLKIYSPCPVSRACAALLCAVVLSFLLAELGLLGFFVSLAGGWFASPYVSPWAQKLLLSTAAAKRLTVYSVTARRRTTSAFGGRFTSAENGVEVATSALDVIEAEVIDG